MDIRKLHQKNSAQLYNDFANAFIQKDKLQMDLIRDILLTRTEPLDLRKLFPPGFYTILLVKTNSSQHFGAFVSSCKEMFQDIQENFYVVATIKVFINKYLEVTVGEPEVKDITKEMASESALEVFKKIGLKVKLNASTTKNTDKVEHQTKPSLFNPRDFSVN